MQYYFARRCRRVQNTPCKLLKKLSKSKYPKDILKKSTNKIIKSVRECILNVRGNVPLTKKQKNKLSIHKRSLRKLSNKKVPLYKKKKTFSSTRQRFFSQFYYLPLYRS